MDTESNGWGGRRWRTKAIDGMDGGGDREQYMGLAGVGAENESNRWGLEMKCGSGSATGSVTEGEGEKNRRPFDALTPASPGLQGQLMKGSLKVYNND